jgi:hypothetical protein
MRSLLWSAQEELTMKIKRSLTNKTIAANAANARESPGPTTAIGKRHSRMNSYKHGFFAKELQFSEQERPEFEALRDNLSHQFEPATPMQQIALDKIVCCCWRCKLALRIESLAVAFQQSSTQEASVGTGVKEDTTSLEIWYGCDYRSLQNGLRFLRELRIDVTNNGLLHLEQDGPLKESIIKGFGQGFYGRLMEWKGMSIDAIVTAEHIARSRATFKTGSIDFNHSRVDPKHPELPNVVPDPRLQLQMVVKLVDVEIEHLETLVRTRGQEFSQTPLVLAELSPRYYANASRDLERSVDWFLILKETGL